MISSNYFRWKYYKNKNYTVMTDKKNIIVSEIKKLVFKELTTNIYKLDEDIKFPASYTCLESARIYILMLIYDNIKTVNDEEYIMQIIENEANSIIGDMNNVLTGKMGDEHKKICSFKLSILNDLVLKIKSLRRLKEKNIEVDSLIQEIEDIAKEVSKIKETLKKYL